MQMRDVFNGGDTDEFLTPTTLQVLADQDMYLIIELLGYDEANTLEYVLGEK